jgi:gamma-glutamyltranspeptidase/glutathione hydrolase
MPVEFFYERKSIAVTRDMVSTSHPLASATGAEMITASGNAINAANATIQPLFNKIGHGMSVQQKVEAPRIWTQGHGVKIEDDFPVDFATMLTTKGYKLNRVPYVCGRLNAIKFDTDGQMTGASCWRTNGTPVGLGGGYARRGAQFWHDQHGR